MKLSELALKLNVSKETVENWRKKEIINCQKINGTWYVTNESFNRLRGLIINENIVDPESNSGAAIGQAANQANAWLSSDDDDIQPEGSLVSEVKSLLENLKRTLNDLQIQLDSSNVDNFKIFLNQPFENCDSPSSLIQELEFTIDQINQGNY